MAKPTFGRKQIITVIVFVLLAVTAIFAVTLFIIVRGSHAPAALKDESFRGTVMCLPHKNTDGPQTMECAYGLKTDDNVYYGLRDRDPGYGTISKLPMNEKVKVSGTLTRQTSEIYPTIGTIEVTSVTDK